MHKNANKKEFLYMIQTRVCWGVNTIPTLTSGLLTRHAREYADISDILKKLACLLPEVPLWCAVRLTNGL